ncbi:DUF2268 domain-containing putative Zn-dependent protease [Neobacillus sp. D3-1R]|uniref:DUF2268 domain-containing putative Zn-dependent protease n=1 Tax=Neobacillus sp. D3-1R TaxID=3445778 RepID=UPI003FA0D2CC
MKYFLKIGTTFILIYLLLSLTSCTQTEKTKKSLSESNEKQIYENIVSSFEHPQTKQKYKIVNAYKFFPNYIAKVKDKPSHSKMDIYKEEVIKPIYNDCFQNGEYLHMADSILNVAPERLTEMEILTEKMESKETDKIIREALIKSSNLLSSEKETTVCVFPSTNVNAAMVTVGAGKIIVLYNRYYTDDAIRAGLAHEYHHSVWTEKYLNKNSSVSVLDNLIFEGKAVMYEKVVYPEIDFTPVDLTYNKDNWSKVEPDLEKYDLMRSLEIIRGGKDLPRFYGYSEGYKMVKSYLELHPNETPEEWTALSSKDIFEKGQYLENYK